MHEVTIKSGQRHERHLCEGCAKADGLPVQSNAPITQLLTQYITSQIQATAIGPGAAGAGKGAKAKPGAIVPNACPACGHTHSQFRQTGLLGCPECYAAFEGQLTPLLARAHDGGTTHTGKIPQRLRAGGDSESSTRAGKAAREDDSNRASELRARLTTAVAAENYELAATIRDELARLQSSAAATPKKGQSSRAAKSRKATPPPPAPPEKQA